MPPRSVGPQSPLRSPCRSAAARAACKNLPLRGWDHAGQADEFFGILRFVVDPDLIVHMRPGAAAGAAEKADLLMLGDPLPDRNDIAVKMGIKGGDAVSVIDLDHLAIVADIAGVGHDSRRGGMNRGHVGRR